MNCFDCLLIEGKTTPAIGVCSSCGGGLCSKHAVIEPVVVTVTSMGNPSTHRGHGRRLHCSQCAASVGLTTLPDHVAQAVQSGGNRARAAAPPPSS